MRFWKTNRGWASIKARETAEAPPAATHALAGIAG
jgi:hypothetical protein